MPLLLDPLPTVTDEPVPPPGDIVVEPLTEPPPAVIEVEFEVVRPPSCVVTTRHGLPLTMVVPFGPDVTATLSANTGAALAKNPTSTGTAAFLSRMKPSTNT